MARVRSLAVATMVVLLVAGGLLPIAAAPMVQGPETAQPNILLILTDDLDGAAIAELPNVRRLLADRGTTFPNFFVSSPNCCPSRASILRGQFAHNHGVLRNSGKDGGFRTFHSLDRESETIGVWMQRAGYRTGLMGKYLNGYPTGVRDTWTPPGWDEWAVPLRSGYIDYEMNENGSIVEHGSSPEDYLTDLLTAKAAAFVDAAASDGRPFFLYLSPRAPHSPTTPAERHAGAFAGATAPRPPSWNEADVSDKPNFVRTHAQFDDAVAASIDDEYRLRREAMLAVDDMVAGLVAALERAETLDQTYILFASDNGFHLGQHRLPSRKGTPYDEAIRVPLIVRGPGVPQGVVNESLVMNVDLAPTFAALGGAAVPDWLDGRSLAPLFDGSGAGTRRVVFVEDFGGEGSRRKFNRPTMKKRGNGIPPFRALRTPELLYVEYASGERELYDRQVDPYELENIVDRADPDTVAVYSERVNALSRCARDRCRGVENAPLPKIGPLSDREPGAVAAAPGVRVLPVSADAAVSADGDAPAGDEPILTIGGDGAPSEAFMRFEVPKTQQPIRSVTLRLHVADGEPAADAFAVWAVDPDWEEGAVSWQERPSQTRGRIGRGTLAGDGSIDFDLTKLVRGAGSYALVIRSGSEVATGVWSRDGDHPPEVRITTGDFGAFAHGRRPVPPKADSAGKGKDKRERGNTRERGKDDRREHRGDRERDRRENRR